MKRLKYLLYFIVCVLLLTLAACHLDTTEPPPKDPPPTKPTPPPKSHSLVWSGSVSVTSAEKYRDFLRSHRKCDPCSIYKGPLECKNFDSRADVTIELSKNELPSQATLTIQPHYSGSGLPFQLYLGVCGFTVSPTLPIGFKGTAQYINDYEGFHVRLTEAVDNGFGGGLGTLFIRSESSNPAAHGILDVDLYYGGAAKDEFQFGTAELVNPELDNLDHGYTGGR